jgi:hypothetical protein
MEQKFGSYILLGFLGGAIVGLFLGTIIDNMVAGLGIGVLGGVFMGWFVAAAMTQEDREKPHTGKQ